MKELIIQYLAQGVAESEVANIVGCSAGLVSQTKNDPYYEVALAEAQAKIKLTEQQKAREKVYESVEDTVLNAVQQNAPFAEYKDLLKTLEVLHRRKNVVHNPNGLTIVNDNRTQNVLLTIPRAAMPEFRLNSRREVVGVDNTSLAPMDSDGVRSLFKTMEVKRKQIADATVVEIKADDSF